MKKVGKTVLYAVAILLLGVFSQEEARVGETSERHYSRTYSVLSANVGNSYWPPDLLDPRPYELQVKLQPDEENKVRKGIQDLKQPDILILIEAYNKDQVLRICNGTGESYFVSGGPYDFVCVRKDVGEVIEHVQMKPGDGNSVGYVDVGLKDEGGRKVRLFYAHFPSPHLTWEPHEHEAHIQAFNWICENLKPDVPCLIAGDLNNDFIRGKAKVVEISLLFPHPQKQKEYMEEQAKANSSVYIEGRVNKLNLWIFNPPADQLMTQLPDGSTRFNYETTYRFPPEAIYKLTIDWVMGKSVALPFQAPGRRPEVDPITGTILTSFLTSPPNWWKDISRLIFDHKPLYGKVVFFWEEGVLPEVGAAVAVVVDRSGSMTGEKVASAKRAAESFFAGLNDSDYSCLISFCSDATTDVGLLRATPENKLKLQTQAGYVEAEGNTNIGAGLTNGLQELDSASDSARKSALLMSDGMHNTGELWPSVEEYEKRRWPVYTVAYGSDADQETLADIARRTGGTHFPASPANITQVYHKINAHINNRSVLFSYNDLIGQGKQLNYSVPIDPDISSATFFADWQGSLVELRLITPIGEEIRPDNFLAIPGVSFQRGATYCFYQVANPVAGNWKAFLFGREIAQPRQQVNFTVSGSSPFMANILGFQPSYQQQETIDIAVKVSGLLGSEIDALKNIKVTAEIKKPSPNLKKMLERRVIDLGVFLQHAFAKKKKIELYDDGQHNDWEAGDGVFAGLYKEADINGCYVITVKIEAQKPSGEKIIRVLKESIQVGPIEDNTVTLSDFLGL